MSNYIELFISVEPKEEGSDILIAQLSELGFESFVETENGFNAYIQQNNYSEDAVKNIITAYGAIFKIAYTVKVIVQQNWNKEWESNFEPINIKNKCYIRAPFHEKLEGFIYDVVIEPKMSFGTGHHTTTQLMIEKLITLHLSDRSLLDMGCGTGVLAIVASMMGANPIVAIDIDDWSCENTIENLRRNNINNLLVHKGNAQILAEETFHTILANINKNVLLADMKIYTRVLEKDGNLILSGFFETDVDELSTKALTLGLKLEGKIVNNEWAMLHYVKI